jgi:hypothetical protein
MLIDQENASFYFDYQELIKWKRKNVLDPIYHFGLEIIDSEGNSFIIKRRVRMKEPESLLSKLDFLGNSRVEVEIELVFHKLLDLEIIKLKSCRILLSNKLRPFHFIHNYPDLIKQMNQKTTVEEVFRCLQEELWTSD